MGPITEIAEAELGESVVVKMGLNAGFELGAKVADSLIIAKPLQYLLPIRSERLKTTATKTLTITLKFEITMQDAALGFFRASLHQ
jgi:hypothetical protein